MSEHKNGVTRRDFLRGTLGITLGTTMIGLPRFQKKEKPVRSSTVIIVRDENAMNNKFVVNKEILKTMLDNTVKQVTGKSKVKEAWLSLISPKDKVGLVPTPHLNPTHDELIDVVTQSLIDIGVPKENIMNAQGNPSKPKACTALITMPGLKAHWLTGIGTVIKNYIMYSGNPRRYHMDDNAKLGEIWNLPFVKDKTKLVLVDALYPLCDKGPQSDPRYKWAYNGLIAGTDPVAVETVCLGIINQKRTQLRGEPWPLSPPPLCIEAADKQYDLGTSKKEEIKIKHFGWEKDLLI